MPRPPLGRQLLLDAARAELRSAGGTLDLGSVVDRANLTTGAIYHHFGSKTALLAAVHDAFFAGLDEAIANAQLPEDGTWAERERDRTARMVSYYYADPLTPLILDRRSVEPEISELVALYFQRLGEAAADNIRRGQDNGELEEALDPAAAGHFVVGGLHQGLTQLLRTKPRPGADQAAEQLWRLTAATLGCSAD